MKYTQNTRVMALSGGTYLDSGTMGKWFGDDLSRLVVGPNSGEHHSKGAYAVAQVKLDGMLIGELRDTASGVTYYVMD